MLKNTYQHTVKTEFSMEGVGVHSGKPATITVKPAPTNSGITFVRTDITDKNNVIPATWNYVTDTRLCTLIGNDDDVTVSTIEHLMSALAVLGLDNAVIEIDGPEMPIMDGSSYPFVEALSKAGLVAQKKPRKAIKVLKNVVVSEDGKEVSLSPSDKQHYSVEIEFESKAIGYQKCEYGVDIEHYIDEIAPARTFGFLHEVEYLRSIGLAKGGSLDNAVVVKGDNVINPEGLRFNDEFARHKLLDAIGDIYTAGMPVLAKYHGFKVSHAMNNKVLKALFSDPSAYEIVELDTEALPSATKAEAHVTA